jgi:hypothetical protein
MNTASPAANGPSASSTSSAMPLRVAGGPLRVSPSAPPSLAWRRVALYFAGGAQLVTISALLSVDPTPVSWSSLLLAIAPALLVAAAVFLPAPASLVASVAGLGVLIAGMAGQATHAGLLFLPAFLVLAVATVLLWRERA